MQRDDFIRSLLSIASFAPFSVLHRNGATASWNGDALAAEVPSTKYDLQLLKRQLFVQANLGRLTVADLVNVCHTISGAPSSAQPNTAMLTRLLIARHNRSLANYQFADVNGIQPAEEPATKKSHEDVYSSIVAVVQKGDPLVLEPSEMMHLLGFSLSELGVGVGTVFPYAGAALAFSGAAIDEYSKTLKDSEVAGASAALLWDSHEYAESNLNVVPFLTATFPHIAWNGTVQELLDQAPAATRKIVSAALPPDIGSPDSTVSSVQDAQAAFEEQYRATFTDFNSIATSLRERIAAEDQRAQAESDLRTFQQQQDDVRAGAVLAGTILNDVFHDQKAGAAITAIGVGGVAIFKAITDVIDGGSALGGVNAVMGAVSLFSGLLSSGPTLSDVIKQAFSQVSDQIRQFQADIDEKLGLLFSQNVSIQQDLKNVLAQLGRLEQVDHNQFLTIQTWLGQQLKVSNLQKRVVDWSSFKDGLVEPLTVAARPASDTPRDNAEIDLSNLVSYATDRAKTDFAIDPSIIESDDDLVVQLLSVARVEFAATLLPSIASKYGADANTPTQAYRDAEVPLVRCVNPVEFARGANCYLESSAAIATRYSVRNPDLHKHLWQLFSAGQIFRETLKAISTTSALHDKFAQELVQNGALLSQSLKSWVATFRTTLPTYAIQPVPASVDFSLLWDPKNDGFIPYTMRGQVNLIKNCPLNKLLDAKEVEFDPGPKEGWFYKHMRLIDTKTNSDLVINGHPIVPVAMPDHSFLGVENQALAVALDYADQRTIVSLPEDLVKIGDKTLAIIPGLQAMVQRRLQVSYFSDTVAAYLKQNIVDASAPHVYNLASLQYRILAIFGQWSRTKDQLAQLTDVLNIDAIEYGFDVRCNGSIYNVPSLCTSGEVVHYVDQYVHASPDNAKPGSSFGEMSKNSDTSWEDLIANEVLSALSTQNMALAKMAKLDAADFRFPIIDAVLNRIVAFGNANGIDASKKP